MAVYSNIHTKHLNALCGQNLKFLDFKPDSMQSNHYGLKAYTSRAPLGYRMDIALLRVVESISGHLTEVRPQFQKSYVTFPSAVYLYIYTEYLYCYFMICLKLYALSFWSRNYFF